ncbi:MAG: insulinase family protein [Desulfovibrionaceae bacterium]|nr:insulinase family protein [Desulfovibrionaceae bacterium]
MNKTEQLLPDFYWYDGRWPHERSDLPVCPDVRFGRLANGLRWALIPNPLPPGRVCLYLDVQAGSLMETDEERGYAHFVEHMAFKGSRRFGPGELVPFFARLGMSHGRDTNGSTSGAETMYRINLPARTPELIRQGLSVLRDFADGLTFDPREVETEKSIILAEKRLRENEARLAGFAWLRCLYGDTPMSRNQAGLVETVSGATADSLRRFHEKWYRADRMILAVAGDVRPEAVEPLIEEAFGSLAEPSAPLPYPVIPEPSAGRTPVLVQKRPLEHAAVAVLTLKPRAHVTDCREAEVTACADCVARICLRNRLLLRTQAPDAPWLQADFHGNWRSGLAPSSVLTASVRPGGWERTLETLQEETASALTFGFSRGEVATAARQAQLEIRRICADRRRMRSDEVARTFLQSANEDNVWQSPDYSPRRYAELLPLMTPERADEALRQAFEGDTALRVSGPMETDEAAVRALWSRAGRRPPQKPEEVQGMELPPLPAAAEECMPPRLTEESEPLPGGSLPVFRTVLDGGVRVHLAPMPALDRGAVRISLLFGEGLAAMDAGRLDTARLAGRILSCAGPGRLTLRDRMEQLESRGIELSEHCSEYGTLIIGTALKEDMERLVAALREQYADPLPEEGAAAREGRVRELLELARPARFDTVDGMAGVLRKAYFKGENFLPLDADRAGAVSLDMVRAHVAASRAAGLGDIVACGDFDREELLGLLVRAFGATRGAQPGTASAGARHCIFPSRPLETIFVERECVDKAVVRVAFRADLAVEDRRRLAVRRLAAAVLRERMRVIVRGRMGAAYQTGAFYYRMAAYGGFGFMLLEAATSRGRAEEVRRAMLALAARFAADGADRREIDRLRGPMLTTWRTEAADARQIGARLLLQTQSGLPHMRRHAEYGALLAGVTAEEVSAEAARLLAVEPACLVIEGGPLRSGEHAGPAGTSGPER